MASILVYAIYLFTEIITAAMIIRALLSWFARDPYSTVGKIYGVLIRFTEPFVAPCRRLLSRFNTGMIDFSLFLALILVQAVSGLLIRLIYLIF
ncbi:MAG: YggT family protein [Anaerovoracaceae bacterium]|nr:YggT family protein [Bacillota bacterium]MDY5770491.1 YggT family protein [Anaerovoracaceae bacterium]